MPNLINVIRAAKKASSSKDKKDSSGKSAPKKAQTDEERKAEVARLLLGDSAASKAGDPASEVEGDMEWGTVLVFSCTKDCCRVLRTGDDAKSRGGWEDAQAAWKDEYVLIQWDV